MARNTSVLRDPGGVLDDRIADAYSALGNERGRAMAQARAGAFGPQGMGAALGQMRDIEAASGARREQLGSAALSLRDRKAWAALANELKARQSASKDFRQVATDLGHGAEAAIYGFTEGEDTKAFKEGMPERPADPLTQSIRNARTARAQRREDAAAFDEMARRRAYAQEIRGAAAGLPQWEVPRGGPGGPPAQARTLEPTGESGPRVPTRPTAFPEATFGGGGRPSTAQESVWKGVIHRPGDDYEYTKAGDVWLTRGRTGKAKARMPEWKAFQFKGQDLENLEAAWQGL